MFTKLVIFVDVVNVSPFVPNFFFNVSNLVIVVL